MYLLSVNYGHTANNSANVLFKVARNITNYLKVTHMATDCELTCLDLANSRDLT